MTFGGEMPLCALTGSAGENFVVLYHFDNQTCGPFPCGVGQGADPVEVAHAYIIR